MGDLPSNTERNPKEHVKAITLRSGTKYDEPSTPVILTDILQDEVQKTNKVPTKDNGIHILVDLTNTKNPPKEFKLKALFPGRMRNKDYDKQLLSFIEKFAYQLVFY
ncbi:hypothetical protein M5689_013138 [Euphorbia peplus]|nr:hypothetical protein M5689_013138 [Euphorbia peplus]